ncbi:hypothetical protein EMCRGX_G026634 [Ephydatia muelleri]
MLDASKENCIHIPTGGTVSDNQYRLLLFNLHLQPLTLARVTVPKAPITQLSKRTRKRHVLELQRTHNILSGSSDDSGILFEDEVRALSADQRQQLLHSAGIKLNIEPTQGLAIKSMIGLPWYRLRTLSRWLKHSGISFGSERKHRALCRELIRDNLEVELAPFSFKLADGGEEIRAYREIGGQKDYAVFDGGGDYTEEFATYRIDTGVPGHDNQPVFLDLRKHLASLRVLAL